MAKTSKEKSVVSKTEKKPASARPKRSSARVASVKDSAPKVASSKTKSQARKSSAESAPAKKTVAKKPRQAKVEKKIIHPKKLPRNIVARILLWATFILICGFIAVIIYAGFVPGISTLAGASMPRDLGIEYTGGDRANARMKTGLRYGALPAGTPVAESVKRSGSQPLSASFTSAELTALLNDRPYKYWPLEEVQLRINDNSVEISGRIISKNLASFAKAEKIPAQLIESLSGLAPANPVFYIRGNGRLIDGKVQVAQVTRLEIGRLVIPMFILRHSSDQGIKNALAEKTLAESAGNNSNELLDNWLANIEGFSARQASFHDGQLFYDGTISLEELTVR